MIIDVPQLMHMQEYLPKVLISDRAAPREFEVLLRYSKVSSVYRFCPGENIPIGIPLTKGEERMSIAFGSMVSAKSAGDNGQPCLVPLWRQKGGERVEPVRTLALDDL